MVVDNLYSIFKINLEIYVYLYTNIPTYVLKYMGNLQSIKNLRFFII